MSGSIHLSKEDCGAPMSEEDSRSVQLAMLDALAAFCTEHGLRYFLSGGTLLGALRHHGYIPWDDDIDVNMPRPDCEKLLTITGGDVNGYRAAGPDDGTYTNCCNWFRIYDDNTVIENFRRGKARDDPWYHPFYIDIFPLEGLPEKRLPCSLHWARAWYLDKMRWASSAKHLEAGSRAGRAFLVVASLPARAVGYRKWGDRIEKCALRYRFDREKYVGVTTTTHYLTSEKVEKAACMDMVRVEFEGRQYNAPGNYDLYLTQLYGDYMQMPPAEKQKSHHAFNMYWRAQS